MGPAASSKVRPTRRPQAIAASRKSLVWVTHAWLACSLALGMAACRAPEVREEFHPDGSIKSSTFHLRTEVGEVLHGAHQTWHASGCRASLDVYVKGYLQGYSLRWDEECRIRSLARYVDGLPDGEARAWDAEGNLVLCRTAGGGECPAEDAREAMPAPGSPSRPGLAANGMAGIR